MFKIELYPEIEIERNTSPNRFFAFPLLGFLVKLILLIPICFEFIALYIATFFMTFLINPFVVLITGKYWSSAYALNSGIIRLSIKTTFYLWGLTDKYPYFDFKTEAQGFKVDMPMPAQSGRFFAIPLLGYLVRLILLIPYSIYNQVLSYAMFIGTFCSFVPVLFKGYYPVTSYELAKDATRVNQAQMAYFFGLRDSYPSFSISWNNKTMKIVLIVLGVLLFLMSLSGNFMPKPKPSQIKETDFMIDYQTQIPKGSAQRIPQ